MSPLPDEPSKTFREFLLDCGYTGDELVEVENQLPGVFELGFAFSAWSMPESILKDNGLNVNDARADSRFNGLRVLGLSAEEIESLNKTICGTQTIEGAPHLKDEHLPVFDCANKCGTLGKRFIAAEGHIRMMAAAQPFITGAISKTINLPADASETDIADAYWLSWELGLKANALYRDGSKLSQPLNSTADVDDEEEDDDAVEAALEEVVAEVADAAETVANDPSPQPEYVEKIVEKIIERPMRRRLPDTRRSVTHRFNVAGHEGYLTVGLYKDGTPGELFITMSKEGSTIGGLMDSLGTAISVALQYGVPVASLVTKFAHQRFEPMGMTTNQDIPFAKSLVDYIFRWLGMEFIPGYREANAPNRGSETRKETKADAESPATTGSSGSPAPAERKTGTRTEKPVMEDNAWSDRERKTDTSDGAIRAARPADVKAKIDEASSPGSSTSSEGVRQTIAATSAQSSSIRVTDSGIAMEKTRSGSVVITAGALDQSNAALQSDAPACDVCGSITVRNGTCYKCMNCGNSMGCS